MGQYIITITNARGDLSRVYDEYDNARDALRYAARLGHKAMAEAFGPDDYLNGNKWKVGVFVGRDEEGKTYKVMAGADSDAPCIYSKSIPTFLQKEREKPTL